MHTPPAASPTHSIPTTENGKARLSAGLYVLADRVGFEPTSLLRDYLISSQGRYDHFDTCPSICSAIIRETCEKIKGN